MSKVKEQSALLLLWSLSIGLALAVDICEYQIDGVHLLHPADCNKFVECQSGQTHRISSCPLGLHFNRWKGVCDLRQRAGCDIGFADFVNEETDCSACCALYGCFVKPECPQPPGTSTTVTSSPSTSVTPETPATGESTETSATPCAPATPETTNIPVTNSSHSTPDIPATPSVTSATVSSPETPSSPITLSTPETPNSPVTSSTPETPSSPVTSSTPKPPTSPVTSSTRETPTSPVTPVSPETPVTPDITTETNRCPNNLPVCKNESDNRVMHVNGTCNQYIVCVAGCAYIMSCPANLQYDIARQICDYPQNVDCPWHSTPSITGPSGVSCAHHGQCEKQADGKLFADPNSDGYIICQCECEVERPCPEGTRFDAKLLTCAWKVNKSESGTDKNYESNGKAENADKYTNGDGSVKNVFSTVCQNNVEVCRNQTEGKLFPVDGVCNKFYKCNFGCAIEILCPNNLIYNPQAAYCDYPYNYKCPWPFTAPSGPSAGASGIACASGGRCEGKLDGILLPSLTSCAKYVVCQCECEVERDCDKNLYWDGNLLTCNYAANVTCELNL